MNTKSYSFSYPKEAWDIWKRHIPDGKNIDAHLQELIAKDTVDRTNGEFTEPAREQLQLILEDDVRS